MKNAFLFALLAMLLVGCSQKVATSPATQGCVAASDAWQAPDLPEKQQELILDRAVALMKESGKWQGYPLESIGFDEERKQWKLAFSNGKPDGGYHVFIADDKAEGIDILLFPPMWTKYERNRSSNQ